MKRGSAQSKSLPDYSSLYHLFDQGPDAIIIYSAKDNKFVDVNPAACLLVGFTKKEMLRMKVTDFLRPADNSRLKNVKEERKAGSRRLVEWQARRKDGSYIDIEANTHFLEDKELLVSFIRDITERKQMEEAIYNAGVKEQILKEKTNLLQEQQKKLIAINKAKDEFILVASHQLRTPATGVKQYLGMLLDQYFGDLNDKQVEALTTAYASNERQLKIVNDLLMIAKVDSGEIQSTMELQDLVSFIKELTDSLLPAIKQKNQQLKLKLPASLKVPFDKTYLKVAIENIINNAVHYSPAGKPISIHITKRNDTVVIGITDQGVGIRKADQKQLFQKFARINNPLSNAVDGNGLGLYLAKQIIDMHNGRIELQSRIGKGSSFTVTLPLTLIS